MSKIIIGGGGFSACAAALTASKGGAEVTILERTDLLLGLGNVGGIMRNNGRFTAAEENIAMGADELFEITDYCAVHKNIDFPGHNHASFFNVIMVEPEVRKLMKERNIEVFFTSRVVDVRMEGRYIKSFIDAQGNEFEGDAFIDCTGTTGPMGNCTEYGNGCSMCVLRCPAFGPRVSISAKAGGTDYRVNRPDGTPGAFSGSCKLEKTSLSNEIQLELSEKGFAVIPLPTNLVNESKLGKKVCKQYSLPSFAENIILIDTGYAKMMTPYISIEELRLVKGFERACFVDPYAGGKGNSVRFLAIADRDEAMKVADVDNLFCGGEKAGPYIGHTEAITTGSLAGANAARFLAKKEALHIPTELAIGEFLQYKKADGGLITFAGDEFFRNLKRKKLYSTNINEIRKRVDSTGLTGIYNLAVL